MSKSRRKSYRSSSSRESSKSCPTGLAFQLDPHTRRVTCANPKLAGEYKSLKKLIEKSERDKRKYNKEIMDLVSPYQVNPYQRRILSYVIGKEPVDRMEATNALVYAGIIDNTCPVGMEEYLHALSGKRQCRPRLRRVVQFRGAAKCPQERENPYAIEHYVDTRGVGRCRQPVLHGQFSCPPHNAPDKTEHLTLPDGTGICVAPRVDIDSEFFIPDHVVYPRGILAKVAEFEKLFERFNLDEGHIRFLNQALLHAGGEKGELAKRLKQHMRGGIQRTLEEELMRKIASDQELHIALHGLFEYARKNNPEIFHGLVPTKGEFLRMITGDSALAEVKGGGKRRRKKSKKSKKSKKI